MKHFLGMVAAAGLAFGFASATFESAQAAAHSTGASNFTPVARQCITYHHHYYCLADYYAYGCIYYGNYIYCPAPRPYGGGYNGGSDYNGGGGSTY